MKGKENDMKTRIYLGLAAGHKREIFRSPTTPTETSHGHLYAMAIGPFRTVRGATFMRDKGEGNPHCVCVAQAEYLGKKYAKPISSV